MGNKRVVLKLIMGTIAGIGATRIMTNIIDATMPPGVKLLTRMCTWVGGAAISWMVGCTTADFAEKCVDTTVQILGELLGNSELNEGDLEEAVVE